MNAASHRLRLGTFDCLVVKDGNPDTTPVSKFMTDAPDELADRAITLLAGLMVVDAPDGSRFLVDTENGPTEGHATRSFRAPSAFAAEGIEPDSVDTILLTHGDFDHIGGLIDNSGSLAFPNAHFVLHRDLWDLWHDGEARAEFAPRLIRILKPLLPLLEDRATVIEEEQEVLPGVRAIPALGHRCGHTLYMIESEGRKLLHIGDAAVDPVFLEYPGKLNAHHDSEPESARDARRMISARTTAEGAMVVGSHFGLPGVGRLAKIAEDRYRWSPVTD